MIEFLIKSTVCMGVLLGVYYLFMQNEKMHTFKRFYLIFSVIFSLTLPFIEYNRYYEVEQTQMETVAAQPYTVQTLHETPAATIIENTDYTPYFILSLYSVGVLVMAVRFILNITGLLRKAKKGIKLHQQNALIILLEEQSQPYTFLNYIFINKEEHENNALEQELYTHELVHVRQKHTLDILFIEVLKIVFWFNPFLYFYKKAMQLNHEFLADEKVITVTNDIAHYQNLLLTRVSGSYTPLTSSISYSITKNRFLMMTKTSGKLKIAFKQFLTIPIATILFTVLCINNIEKANAAILQHKTTDVKQPDPTEEDKRRDNYYAGVWMKIEDKTRNLTIDKPYEELTLEQKREYLFYVPNAKTKKAIAVKEYEDYKNKAKYAIWIDGKNVDNTALNKYKNTDFAYVTGSSVFKSARTKEHPQPYQFSLYTNTYFDKNFKNEHLKYPSKVFTLSISPVDKKNKTTSKKKNQGITSYAIDYPASEPDTYASFKEGFKNYPNYVEKNFKNPYDGRSGIVIRLKYDFVIEANGTITNIKIEAITTEENEETKAAIPLLEKELIKVVKASESLWKPAIKNGKPISTTVAMPFVLDITI